MNILCISHEYPPVGGGGATACLNISWQLARMGHRVTILTSSFEDAPLQEEAHGVTVLRARCKRANRDHSSFAEMLHFLFAAYRMLPGIVKRGAFDVVQVYFGIPSGPLGWFILKRWKIPYVVRLGGGDVPGTQARFEKVYRLVGPFLKHVWGSASFVVANSQGICDRARAFSDGARFAIIPNGINAEDFPRPVQVTSDDVLEVMTTARIVERKGIQHVLRALPELVRETDGNVRYTIIGDGPYRTEIEALARRLNVLQYVRITGMVDRAEVLNILSGASVFVLTSDWEGMPNVVLEAMAMGLPVVMTDCEGSAELIGDNGFVLKRSEDIPPQVAQAVLKLYRAPELARSMGVASRKLATEHFTWKKTAQLYLQLFSEIIGDAKA